MGIRLFLMVLADCFSLMNPEREEVKVELNLLLFLKSTEKRCDDLNIVLLVFLPSPAAPPVLVSDINWDSLVYPNPSMVLVGLTLWENLFQLRGIANLLWVLVLIIDCLPVFGVLRSLDVFLWDGRRDMVLLL